MRADYSNFVGRDFYKKKILRQHFGENSFFGRA